MTVKSPLKESFCSSFMKIDNAATFNLNATDAPSRSHTGQCFEMQAQKFQYC